MAPWPGSVEFSNRALRAAPLSLTPTEASWDTITDSGDPVAGMAFPAAAAMGAATAGATVKVGATRAPAGKLGIFREEAPGMGLLRPVAIIGVTDTPVTGPRAMVCAEAVKT